MLQSWHELLTNDAPDSFQARTLDLALLLDDMAHVASVAAEDDRWRSYLGALSTELSRQAADEQRLLTGDHRLAVAVNSVISKCRDSTAKAADLHRHILVARGVYGDPAARLLKDGRNILVKFKREKRDLQHRLSTLCTHILYRGLGDESLSKIDDRLLLESPVDVFEVLAEPIARRKDVYRCIVAVEGPQGDIEAAVKAKGYARAGRPDFRPDAISRSWESKHKNCYNALVQCEAISARHAAELASERLLAVLNVHNLYLNSASLRVCPTVLIYVASQVTAVEITPSKHYGLVPRGRARELMRNRVENLGDRLNGRLANALRSHALALSATDPTSAITNLWTALETLAGSLGGGAIGDRVAATLAPHIAWRRVDRIVTYLAISCHQAVHFVQSHLNLSILSSSNAGRVGADDVLRAVTGHVNNPAAKELMNACSDSPLLLNRLSETWTVFHDPSQLRNRLIQSRDRVQWQLLRLYRARNLLVHKGQHSHLIWRLLQHAQYYVSLSLGKVMHDLSGNPGWDIDTSLHSQKEQFDYVCANLDQKNCSNLTHADFLAERSVMPTRKVWS
ncbi:MAG: hypothetical protein P4L92_00150 [Rudaea sp.]|nr:hypothetical protein [Rudaea sp.]